MNVLSKQMSLHNGSICASPDILLRNCIAAASTNESGICFHQVLKHAAFYVIVDSLMS